MIEALLLENSEVVTQLFIGAATVVITGVSYLNSRRAAKMSIYQSYLDAWHELNNIRIQQDNLRELVASGEWPERRADQILLEAFSVKYLDILALSYQASKFGALTHHDFVSDARDVLRELGFLAPVAKRFVDDSAFAVPVKREFNRAYKLRFPADDN